jgi:hypothetical protein
MPRRSRTSCSLGGADPGSTSTLISSFSLTGRRSSIRTAVAMSWPLWTANLYSFFRLRFGQVTGHAARRRDVLPHRDSFDLDLLVDAEPDPDLLIPRRQRHAPLADIDPVAADQRPSRHQRRLLDMLEGCLDERRRIELWRRLDYQLRNDGRG